MQATILIQELSTSLNELKASIEKFERHPLPSIFYTEGLHLSIQKANKIVSAYLVLMEQQIPIATAHVKVEKAVDVSEPIAETKSTTHTIANNIANTEQETVIEVTPVVDVIEPITIAEPAINVIEKSNEVIDVTVQREIKSTVELKTQVTETIQSIALVEIETKTISKELQKISININDKFRFINELFASKAIEYNNFVDRVNSISSKNEMDSYLIHLKATFNWQDNNETVKSLVSLANKRFL